jgi:L-aspartate oxidase
LLANPSSQAALTQPATTPQAKAAEAAEASEAFDVLVIGGGAAGLYAALCLPAHLKVALITKDDLSISASDWAQGGIAAALSPEDSAGLHIEDTLKAGAGLCEPAAVELLVQEARVCIESLVNLGVAFDRSGDQLAMTLEAAHSRKRVLHAADTTGHAIVSTLGLQVLQRQNVRVFNQTFVLDLWTDESGCRGVCLCQNLMAGEEAEGLEHPADGEGSAGSPQMRWIPARAVVLATGGGGQVFSQTTNPAASTGDGVAIAWRAGAQLRDLEFFQFHPTALTLPDAPRFLISEAVRGEGAHLLDDEGRRFTFDYHPDGELAPRDVVSRAIFSHLQKTGKPEGRVWLDLSNIEPERIRYRFPNIIQVCKHWGIDLFNEPIPVSPAAHYWMGGITCGLQSETTVNNLYAVGENSSTGVHGANRLASNSLLECLVYGAQLKTIQPAAQIADVPVVAAKSVPLNDDWLSVVTQWRSQLPQLIWQNAGICRTHQGMAGAIAQVAAWQSEFDQLSISQALQLRPGETAELPASVTMEQIRLWGEVRNLFAIATLILKSADFRTESRGGHYRSDYPHSSDEWLGHSVVAGCVNGQTPASAQPTLSSASSPHGH